MSKISSKLASHLDKWLEEFRRRNLPHEPAFDEPNGVYDYKDLVEKGFDPLHAIYICIQNLVSVFAEEVSAFREFKQYAAVVSKAEDEYMPLGPPMSPLTVSFFTTWAFFDFRFSKDRETIGTVMLDVADKLHMDAISVEALRQFQESRMGIYEYLCREGDKTKLRELWTDKEFLCHVPANHQGKRGELWYARLCPPIIGLEGHHVVMTTPYILQRTKKDDWIAFLNRSLLKAKDKEVGLYQFLKFGKEPNYWSEFVFLAYCGHTNNAVFLAGIPDIRSSLPHAD